MATFDKMFANIATNIAEKLGKKPEVIDAGGRSALSGVSQNEPKPSASGANPNPAPHGLPALPGDTSTGKEEATKAPNGDLSGDISRSKDIFSKDEIVKPDVKTFSSDSINTDFPYKSLVADAHKHEEADENVKQDKKDVSQDSQESSGTVQAEVLEGEAVLPELKEKPSPIQTIKKPSDATNTSPMQQQGQMPAVYPYGMPQMTPPIYPYGAYPQQYPQMYPSPYPQMGQVPPSMPQGMQNVPTGAGTMQGNMPAMPGQYPPGYIPYPQQMTQLPQMQAPQQGTQGMSSGQIPTSAQGQQSPPPYPQYPGMQQPIAGYPQQQYPQGQTLPQQGFQQNQQSGQINTTPAQMASTQPMAPQNIQGQFQTSAPQVTPTTPAMSSQQILQSLTPTQNTPAQAIPTMPPIAQTQPQPIPAPVPGVSSASTPIPTPVPTITPVATMPMATAAPQAVPTPAVPINAPIQSSQPMPLTQAAVPLPPQAAPSPVGKSSDLLSELAASPLEVAGISEPEQNTPQEQPLPLGAMPEMPPVPETTPQIPAQEVPPQAVTATTPVEPPPPAIPTPTQQAPELSGQQVAQEPNENPESQQQVAPVVEVTAVPQQKQQDTVPTTAGLPPIDTLVGKSERSAEAPKPAEAFAAEFAASPIAQMTQPESQSVESSDQEPQEQVPAQGIPEMPPAPETPPAPAAATVATEQAAKFNPLDTFRP
ncbi:MAG: hypothetical protein QY314_03595 [Candidatus Dojkabacteria bacterium]|nr:MAG: hypothetical protein QY314_03595 [Candidatus Dojkabacteria bacterium]